MGSLVDDDVAALLHQVGQRYTDGRRRVVAVLARAGRPLTLPEILDRNDALSQSSVYRTLDVLERAGVVRRIVGGPASEHAHFELSELLLDHHHHLICLGCGTIEDVLLDEEVERAVDEALGDAAAAAGFTPVHHSVDLHGHCADCAGVDAQIPAAETRPAGPEGAAP